MTICFKELEEEVLGSSCPSDESREVAKLRTSLRETKSVSKGFACGGADPAQNIYFYRIYRIYLFSANRRKYAVRRCQDPFKTNEICLLVS